MKMKRDGFNRCAFCNCVVKFEDLQFKDGNDYYCKEHHEFMQQLMKIWRGEKK